MPEYDVLVVGGGVAGLRAAIAAKQAGARVALLSKTHPLRSHSATSPGGLNAACGSDDSWEKHLQELTGPLTIDEPSTDIDNLSIHAQLASDMPSAYAPTFSS